MAFDLINTGTRPNDGTGDTLYAAFTKVNEVISGLANLAVGARTIEDVSADINAGDAFVVLRPLTATRTLRLPDHARYPVGPVLTIADGTGACSDAIRIVISVRPGAPILGISNPDLRSAGASISLRLLPSRDAWILV